MSSLNHEKFLCLDIGERRIGMALSRGFVAGSYGTVVYTKPEDAIKRIVDIIFREKITSVIYGIPLNSDGLPGKQADKIFEFISRLKSLCNSVSFIYWNEALTSWQAELLLKGKVRKKKRKEVIDKISATLILQSYLNSKQRRL